MAREYDLSELSKGSACLRAISRDSLQGNKKVTHISNNRNGPVRY